MVGVRLPKITNVLLPFYLLTGCFAIVEVQMVKDYIAAGRGSLSAYLLIRVNCRKGIKVFAWRWSANPCLPRCFVSCVNEIDP
ncbi:hypothetical protein CEXT_703651 [Caerostris extrusa]|uniref:Secreted protein n=1 Tax=Caerostris extrusa TaxID=172846 RepID=A0AAV4MCQ4_CAEEX|nr:hypothetical protein CEXT_703651 [Caerostris extrusa]